MLHDERRSSLPSGTEPTGRRPRLAFVSPLPPQPTGIADYSAELVPALARHYDITLVSEEPVGGDPLLASAFPRLDPSGFAAAASAAFTVVRNVAYVLLGVPEVWLLNSHSKRRWSVAASDVLQAPVEAAVQPSFVAV